MYIYFFQVILFVICLIFQFYNKRNTKFRGSVRHLLAAWRAPVIPSTRDLICLTQTVGKKLLSVAASHDLCVAKLSYTMYCTFVLFDSTITKKKCSKTSIYNNSFNAGFLIFFPILCRKKKVWGLENGKENLVSTIIYSNLATWRADLLRGTSDKTLTLTVSADINFMCTD